MGTSTFQQGQAIELKGTKYNLLRKVSDNLWQLEETRTKRILEMTDTDLRLEYSQGNLTFVRDGDVRPALGTAHRDIPPADWEVAKIRRAYVMAVLDYPSTKDVINPIISNLWEKLSAPTKMPCASSVLQWKKQYIAAGKDIHALIDNANKKGNRTSRFPEEVEVLVEDAIDKTFMTRERKTLQDALDKAMGSVLKENNLRPAVLALPLPTRRLMQRIITRIPAFDRCVARFGQTAATKRFRSVLAHRTTEGPLERAEIDHTQLDLMVIDDVSGLPLGRPWVTACIDDYTRCILGINIGFEPPSYVTVARCLKHAFLPKAELKRQYPDIVNDWEAHGVMRELVVDNGLEFHSVSLENACFSLGIEIHYSARKTPWFKGKIERFFGTFNAGVAHGNPGSTFSNIFEKDDYDPSKHAVVRLDTLQKIIRMWIADVYHQKPHRTLQAPPAEYWKKNIDVNEILLPDEPASLDAILGRCEKRRLTHKGIELDGLFYNSRDLDKLRRLHGPMLDVELRVDDMDIGHIIVFSPDMKQRFTVSANSLEYANGLTRWQHRVCKRFAANQSKSYDPTSWIEAKDAISRLVQDDLMQKKQKTRSKIARFTTVNAAPAQATTTAAPSIATPSDSTPVNVEPPHGPPDMSPETQATPMTSHAPDTALNAPRYPVKKFAPVYRDRGQQHIDADQKGDNDDA